MKFTRIGVPGDSLPGPVRLLQHWLGSLPSLSDTWDVNIAWLAPQHLHCAKPALLQPAMQGRNIKSEITPIADEGFIMKPFIAGSIGALSVLLAPAAGGQGRA